MKTYKRTFETQIDLDMHTRYADEVISLIENDTINVFRPDDGLAVSGGHNEQGKILMDARATGPVTVQFYCQSGN